MSENNVGNQTYDFSTSAKMKRFLRANKKNFIALAICCGFLILLLAVVIGFAASDSDDYLTLENYEKIEIGMTYDEVVEVLDNHIGIVAGGSGNVYFWEDSSGERRISVGFGKDDRVHSKSQKGLD